MNVKPGDLFAFAGRGWVSNAIKLFTCSRYSHVAGVAQIERRHLDRFKFPLNVNFKNDLYLVESTTLNGVPCLLSGKPVRGVQAQPIADRIAAYDGGVWQLPLCDRWALEPHESDLLTFYLLSHIGRPYPKYELGFAGGKFLKRVLFHPETFHHVFCSQLWCGALERVQRHPLVNASKVNPGQLIDRLVDDGTYLPPVRVK